MPQSPGSNSSAAVPGIFIIGVAKCGTSSLYVALNQHPDVCGSTPKETNFLVDLDNPEYPGRVSEQNVSHQGLEGYAQFFPNRQPGQVLLDATPSYLFQQTALDVIASLPDTTQVIVILRRPAERIYSLFNYVRDHIGHLDSKLSFSEFLDMVHEPGQPKLQNRPILEHVIKQTRYVDVLEPWREQLGTERLRVLLMEDLKRDPRAYMSSLSPSLGLSPEPYEDMDFGQKNVTRTVRAPGLHRVVRTVARALPVGAATKRKLRQIYHRINYGSKSGPSDADRQALRELDELFAADNQRLADTYGLDLSSWSATPSS